MFKLGNVLVTNQDLSELHRVKGFPDLRNVSLVHHTIYYIGIISFVSSDICLLSSGKNRKLIVAGIHFYECYSVLQCFAVALVLAIHLSDLLLFSHSRMAGQH